MSKFIYILDWVIDLDDYSIKHLYEIADELDRAVTEVEDELRNRGA